MLGDATRVGARNGFAETRDRAPEIAVLASPWRAETARAAFEPRKSPQIGGYWSETTNRRFAEECMVADAFAIEPVSMGKFPANRENNREFRRFSSFHAKLLPGTAVNPVTCVENSLRTEQGIFRRRNREFVRRTGNIGANNSEASYRRFA